MIADLDLCVCVPYEPGHLWEEGFGKIAILIAISRCFSAHLVRVESCRPQFWSQYHNVSGSRHMVPRPYYVPCCGIFRGFLFPVFQVGFGLSLDVWSFPNGYWVQPMLQSTGEMLNCILGIYSFLYIGPVRATIGPCIRICKHGFVPRPPDFCYVYPKLIYSFVKY